MNRERCSKQRKHRKSDDDRGAHSGLTTQAQRPGARDATMATATLPPGSLQRMVRSRCHRISSECLFRFSSLRVFRINAYINTNATTQPKPYIAIAQIGVPSENFPSGGMGM